MLPLHERGARLTYAQKSRHTAHYETFLARHRKLPGVNVEKLSLMPGDPGYVLWGMRTVIEGWRFQGGCPPVRG
ncbi:hypothetical protein AnigIFM50267_000524 [Aspergillus niger]|nr:hypothetical protein AnigIFM50267_000524 [Aspergillus niger]